MKMNIRVMTIEDYDDVIALWKGADGIGLSDADSKEGIERSLHRNPALSFVAHEQGRLVGAVLSGHDGRRGYIHHLAVRKGFRQKGLGLALVHHCVSALKKQGILKCHAFVFKDNESALAFWRIAGWDKRRDLVIVSQNTANAG